MDDLSPIIGREPLVGDGGACDVATELFEFVALGGFTDGGGVERKARLPGEQGGWEGFGLYRDGAQSQCFPVGVGPDGDPVVDRGADELIESLAGLEVEVVAVCIAHEQAKAFEQTGHPLADGVQQLRELGASRPRCPTKRRAASFEVVRPVEKEHMEVNIEVQRRTEPLDQGDRTGLGAGGDGERRLFDEASRDRTVDDARDLAQYLRPGGEQEA